MKKLLSLLIISIFISSIASAGLFKSAEEKAMEAEIEEELFGDAKTGLAITRLRRAYTGCTENSDGSLTVRFQRPWKDEETKILEPKCVNGVAYKRFCEEKNGVQTFNPRFAKEDCECDDKGKRCLRDENDVSDDTFASPPDVDTEEYESFSCSSLGEEWFCATPQLARQECGNKGYRLSTFTKCLDKGFCAICGDEKYKGIKFTCANGQKYTERGRCLSKDDLQEIALDFCEDKCISSDCRENSIDNDGDRVVGRDACTRKRIDCNDFDPNIHPGAVEVCDGFDNNCNGKVDEGPFSDRCNDCECKYGNLLCTEKACAETCTRGDTKDCGQGVQTCIQCSATMDCIGETTWSECSDEVCGPQAIPDCKQGFNIVEIKKANGCFDYTCQEIEKPSPEECNTIIPDCAPLVPIPFEMDNGCLDYSCAFPEGDLCNAGETHDCFTGENGNVLGIKECVKNPISDRYEFQEECAALYGCQAPWPLCDKETEEVITDIGEDGCQIYSCGPKQEEKEKCKEYDHICKEDWIPTPHIGWSGCMDGFGCSPPDQHDCLPGETRECGTGGQQKCELEPNSNDYIWRDCLAPNCQANWPDCDGVITTTYVDDCPKYSCEPTPPSLVIPCTAEDREFYKIPDVEDEVCASLNTDIYDCGQHKYCEMTMRNGPFACRHDWVLGYEKGPCENTCLNNQLDTGESLVDQGGPCPRSPELERQCSDQVLNGNEDDTDCGGDCPACDVVPTCNDGVQNGRETGEDCGGPCPVPPLECGEGEVREFTLYNEKNCPEYTCVNLKETDHCNNGYWDNIEIGVDCGGACPECQVICNNGERDADEISVDCGGTNCEPCPKPNHCYNKYQNSDETDVDCGGSCGPCPPFPTDPTNKTNETNESPKKPPTVPPSCNDGIKNGNEIGKDCGGSCPLPCPPDPTCDDGIKNQD